MSHDRLMHDAAWACARALTEMVAPALRPEEQAEYFASALEAVRAAIEAFEIRKDREQMRLKPNPN